MTIAPRSNPSFKPSPEIKTVDVPLTIFPIDDNGEIGILNYVVQGPASYQRNGNRIELKSIRFRATYNCPLGKTGDGTNDTWRIVLAYDRQPTGNPINQADLMRSIDQSGGVTTGAWTDLNMNNSERFKILCDIMATTPDNSDNPLENNVAMVKGCKVENPIDRYIKLKGLYTKFTGTADPMTIANIVTGTLLVYVVGSRPNGAQAVYNLWWSARLRYWDT